MAVLWDGGGSYGYAGKQVIEDVLLDNIKEACRKSCKFVSISKSEIRSSVSHEIYMGYFLTPFPKPHSPEFILFLSFFLG